MDNEHKHHFCHNNKKIRPDIEHILHVHVYFTYKPLRKQNKVPFKDQGHYVIRFYSVTKHGWTQNLTDSVIYRMNSLHL